MFVQEKANKILKVRIYMEVCIQPPYHIIFQYISICVPTSVCRLRLHLGRWSIASKSVTSISCISFLTEKHHLVFVLLLSIILWSMGLIVEQNKINESRPLKIIPKTQSPKYKYRIWFQVMTTCFSNFIITRN